VIGPVVVDDAQQALADRGWNDHEPTIPVSCI
jgi:hypothetical protein